MKKTAGEVESGRSDLKEQGERLHARLLPSRDVTVSSEIAEQLLPLVIRLIKAKFYYVADPHLLETVVEDSFLRYFDDPGRFDPARSSLVQYLYMDAYWDVRNLLEKEKKVVELQDSLSEHRVNPASPGQHPEAEFLERELSGGQAKSPLLEAVLAKVTQPEDREVLELMMDGVRETKVYAAVLKIESLDIKDQEKVVKRYKDRLKKTVQRALERKRR